MLSYTRSAHAIVRILFMLGLAVAPGMVQTAVVSASDAESSSGATLTVLSTPVEVGAADGAFSAAFDGQRLSAGDVVRTGSGGVAVVTYFDGSESQLGANSQVLIEQAEATPAPQISFTQSAGVTVNHVVPLPPGGSFRTNSPSVAGLVRGTSYVVSVSQGAPVQNGADGEARGPAASSSVTSIVLLTDRDGHVGRVDVVKPGSPEPPVRLVAAGQAAAGSATAPTTTARLDSSSVARLEAAANASKDLAAAQDAERSAHAVEHAMLPLLTSQSADDQPRGKVNPPVPVPVLVVPVPVPVPTGNPAPAPPGAPQPVPGATNQAIIDADQTTAAPSSPTPPADLAAAPANDPPTTVAGASDDAARQDGSTTREVQPARTNVADVADVPDAPRAETGSVQQPLNASATREPQPVEHKPSSSLPLSSSSSERAKNSSGNADAASGAAPEVGKAASSAPPSPTRAEPVTQAAPPQAASNAPPPATSSAPAPAATNPAPRPPATNTAPAPAATTNPPPPAASSNQAPPPSTTHAAPIPAPPADTPAAAAGHRT